MTGKREQDDSGAPRLGFDCPNCGDTTVFDEGTTPDEISGNIYECGGCGENILMENYVGDRREA